MRYAYSVAAAIIGTLVVCTGIVVSNLQPEQFEALAHSLIGVAVSYADFVTWVRIDLVHWILLGIDALAYLATLLIIWPVLRSRRYVLTAVLVIAAVGGAYLLRAFLDGAATAGLSVYLQSEVDPRGPRFWLPIAFHLMVPMVARGVALDLLRVLRDTALKVS